MLKSESARAMAGHRYQDITIVGGGLSAASVVYVLLQRMITARENIQSPKIIEPLRIRVFEKTENLWRGVPYGQLANRDHFLIETLEETCCPLFARWLIANKQEVASFVALSTPVLAQWYQDNQALIETGNINKLHFPRRLFGLFVSRLVEEAIVEAKQLGILELEILREEVTDVAASVENEFLITTCSNTVFYSSRVVLAVGSIPKRNPFNVQNNITQSGNYISDSEVCGYLDLTNRLRVTFSNKSIGKLDVVIIGAAASSIETIFYMATNESFLDRIGRITVVSTSGCLVGGIHAVDFSECDLPEYVMHRKSSDIYISTAKKLCRQGVLEVIKGRVVNVQDSHDRYAVVLDKNSKRSSLEADVIINCTGSGTLDNTTSKLINNLKYRFPVNDERRGFNVDETNRIHSVPGLYVVGPLLNRTFSGKQVESISAVFREGNIVANTLFDSFSCSAESQAKEMKCAP